MTKPRQLLWPPERARTVMFTPVRDRVTVIRLANVDNVNAGNIARDLMAITYGLPDRKATRID